MVRSTSIRGSRRIGKILSLVVVLLGIGGGFALVVAVFPATRGIAVPRGLTQGLCTELISQRIDDERDASSENPTLVSFQKMLADHQDAHAQIVRTFLWASANFPECDGAMRMAMLMKYLTSNVKLAQFLDTPNPRHGKIIESLMKSLNLPGIDIEKDYADKWMPIYGEQVIRDVNFFSTAMIVRFSGFENLQRYEKQRFRVIGSHNWDDQIGNAESAEYLFEAKGEFTEGYSGDMVRFGQVIAKVLDSPKAHQLSKELLEYIRTLPANKDSRNLIWDKNREISKGLEEELEKTVTEDFPEYSGLAYALSSHFSE